jgi:hypothetical protein
MAFAGCPFPIAVSVGHEMLKDRSRRPVERRDGELETLTSWRISRVERLLLGTRYLPRERRQMARSRTGVCGRLQNVRSWRLSTDCGRYQGIRTPRLRPNPPCRPTGRDPKLQLAPGGNRLRCSTGRLGRPTGAWRHRFLRGSPTPHLGRSKSWRATPWRNHE